MCVCICMWAPVRADMFMCVFVTCVCVFVSECVYLGCLCMCVRVHVRMWLVNGGMWLAYEYMYLFL